MKEARDNMARYVVPEYEEITQNLEPFIQKNGLDLVTVESLIRGSIEVEEPELPSASIAIVDGSKLSSGASYKIKNVKVNLKFALNSILAFKSVCDQKDKNLILVILKTIVFLLDEMKVTFEELEARVLFCIYRLQSATEEDIVSYVKNSLEKNPKDDDIQIEDVSKALEKLEKIGTVELKDGKYSITETVLIIKR